MAAMRGCFFCMRLVGSRDVLTGEEGLFACIKSTKSVAVICFGGYVDGVDH